MFIGQIIKIAGNSKKTFAYYTFLVCDLEFTTPCWSATLSLLHLTNVGLDLYNMYINTHAYT